MARAASCSNTTPLEREQKVLYLRGKYHVGSIRIVWYLERYHDIKMSDATVSRILRRHGLNRLPRGTRMRNVHTKRYNKQVPGHHIQMDVKYVTFIGKTGKKVRRLQYTAIDDATRVRALKAYQKHTQANAIDFVDDAIEIVKSGRSASPDLWQVRLSEFTLFVSYAAGGPGARRSRYSFCEHSHYSTALTNRP